MKIFAQILFILLILAVLCDGNKRPKRTLGTFLRYFGYRIIPIDDVEFVTESIPESTRSPKALRINTQRPSIKVEETTMKPRKTTTTMRSTTTQSIPKFNPLLPDIINSLFQINFTTMRSPMNVRNSMKKTTLKPSSKVKGTEFLIRPMDVPNMMSQKLTEPMIQPTPEMPQVSDMMQPPSMQGMSMQMNQQGMPIQMSPQDMSMQINSQGIPMQMNQQGMPIQMSPQDMSMQMNQQGMPMQMNQQGMPMQMSPEEMPMQMNSQGMPIQMNQQGMSNLMQPPMQPEMLSGLMESTTEAPMNSTESMLSSMDSPPSQPMDSMPNQPMNSMPNQPMNANQNPEMQAQNFQSLPGLPTQLQNFGNFEMVKSRELPFQHFPGQFIIGNSISVSDFVNTQQHLPFQTQFHTQFSTPHASHFTIARSGKQLKLNNYNSNPVTYYH